ncbi:MAG: S41 family peptidase [Holophagales bacterium]|nr:S41 family peptidase [Holophagales bacterium]MYF94010.1 S41 family peptidase [Holophagales bacterium]
MPRCHAATPPPLQRRPARSLVHSRLLVKQPWRNLALLLFAAAVVVGGLAGHNLLAIDAEQVAQVRLYTDLIEAAHANYAVDDVTYRDLVYASIGGMLRNLDPHTSFLPPVAYDSMRERQQSSFYGLGIYVGTRNNRLTVISPIEGTPGYEKGIRAGDIIHLINGEPTEEMNPNEAIRKLKGPKGTDVTVTLLRPGLDEPLEVTVTRAEIPQETVRHVHMLTPDTGFLWITDFSRSTGGEVARALAELREQGMRRLILDLRYNGGGLLDQAIAVSDQFVPPGTTIVQTRGRIDSSHQAYRSTGRHEPLGLPIVVLVNGSSASASEIVSGAIQDHDVGLVVGESTWGKGLVQTVYELSYGAGLALTTARYYTPAGRLIQRDYSSYWDYYTGYDANGDNGDEDEEEPGPGEPAPLLDPRDEEERPVFYTDLGRKVYGGGGVTPDYVVELEDDPPVITRLRIQSGFHRFPFEQGVPEGVDSTDWRVPDDYLERFWNWIVEEDLVTAEELDEALEDSAVERHARIRLRYEIFNTAFGLTEGFKAERQLDNQLARALELLDEAEELLERRMQQDRRTRGGSRGTGFVAQ